MMDETKIISGNLKSFELIDTTNFPFTQVLSNKTNSEIKLIYSDEGNYNVLD